MQRRTRAHPSPTGHHVLAAATRPRKRRTAATAQKAALDSQAASQSASQTSGISGQQTNPITSHPAPSQSTDDEEPQPQVTKSRPTGRATRRQNARSASRSVSPSHITAPKGKAKKPLPEEFKTQTPTRPSSGLTATPSSLHPRSAKRPRGIDSDLADADDEAGEQRSVKRACGENHTPIAPFKHFPRISHSPAASPSFLTTPQGTVTGNPEATPTYIRRSSEGAVREQRRTSSLSVNGSSASPALGRISRRAEIEAREKQLAAREAELEARERKLAEATAKSASATPQDFKPQASKPIRDSLPLDENEKEHEIQRRFGPLPKPKARIDHLIRRKPRESINLSDDSDFEDAGPALSTKEQLEHNAKIKLATKHMESIMHGKKAVLFTVEETREVARQAARESRHQLEALQKNLTREKMVAADDSRSSLEQPSKSSVANMTNGPRTITKHTSPALNAQLEPKAIATPTPATRHNERITTPVDHRSVEEDDEDGDSHMSEENREVSPTIAPSPSHADEGQAPAQQTPPPKSRAGWSVVSALKTIATTPFKYFGGRSQPATAVTDNYKPEFTFEKASNVPKLPFTPTPSTSRPSKSSRPPGTSRPSKSKAKSRATPQPQTQPARRYGPRYYPLGLGDDYVFHTSKEDTEKPFHERGRLDMFRDKAKDEFETTATRKREEKREAEAAKAEAEESHHKVRTFRAPSPNDSDDDDDDDDHMEVDNDRPGTTKIDSEDLAFAKDAGHHIIQTFAQNPLTDDVYLADPENNTPTIHEACPDKSILQPLYNDFAITIPKKVDYIAQRMRKPEPKPKGGGVLGKSHDMSYYAKLIVDAKAREALEEKRVERAKEMLESTPCEHCKEDLYDVGPISAAGTPAHKRYGGGHQFEAPTYLDYNGEDIDRDSDDGSSALEPQKTPTAQAPTAQAPTAQAPAAQAPTAQAPTAQVFASQASGLQPSAPPFNDKYKPKASSHLREVTQMSPLQSVSSNPRFMPLLEYSGLLEKDFQSEVRPSSRDMKSYRFGMDGVDEREDFRIIARVETVL